jgi:hypothetical protein
MNPEIKKRWVDALRSGKYRQTRSALNDNGGYCCLGVLCELAVEDGVTRRAPIDRCRNGYTFNEDTTNLAGAFPPRAVYKWAGLPEERLGVAVGGTETLAGMNDNGDSFEKIADAIEEYL